MKRQYLRDCSKYTWQSIRSLSKTRVLETRHQKETKMWSRKRKR